MFWWILVLIFVMMIKLNFMYWLQTADPFEDAPSIPNFITVARFACLAGEFSVFCCSIPLNFLEDPLIWALFSASPSPALTGIWQCVISPGDRYHTSLDHLGSAPDFLPQTCCVSQSTFFKLAYKYRLICNIGHIILQSSEAIKRRDQAVRWDNISPLGSPDDPHSD